MRLGENDKWVNLMDKIIFACDIDNTLLRSWRKKHDGDICVEHIDGQPKNYISSKLVKVLNDTASVMRLLPVTTRSVDQFQRINWQSIHPVTNSIVANGGVIFGNTERNRLWRLSNERIFHGTQLAFNEISMLCNIRGLDYRIIDATYLRVIIGNPKGDRFLLELTKKHSEKIYTFRDAKKRYIIPQGISKGSALAFFLNDINYDVLIVAGDNEADISMLNLADIAIVPSQAMAMQLNTPRVVWCNSDDEFAESIAEMIVCEVKGYEGKNQC
jgi:hydroxymethylpyrimidine pyrophosphatase-like HAD family hydrolase